MGWGRIILQTDEKNDEKKKKASKSMDDFMASVIANDKLERKLDRIDRVSWNLEGKKPEELSGPDAWVQDLLHITYGLGRSGRISIETMRAIGFVVAQWHECLRAGESEKDLRDVLEDQMREWYVLYSNAVGILPEDVGRDISFLPIPAKPPYDREGQKLITE